MLKINNKFEILTPTGWCDFDAIKKTTSNSCVAITLESGKYLKCSSNHQLQLRSGQLIQAHLLKVGDRLSTSVISKIEHCDEIIDLFDPINVANQSNTYIADTLIHHNCSFEGSSYTLVDGIKLASIPVACPTHQQDGLEIFEDPQPGHVYTITVDVSRGRHMDYSAFCITDVSQMPYKVVGTYKNNEISTLEFPHLIYNTARQYNNAFLLIEINDLGEEVSNIIWHEYEYENLYFTSGNELSQLRGYPGIRTTSKVKGLGCSVLKELIEKDQLIINSHRIIEELGLFVLHRKSYASADPSVNDDLCTTLWLLAWLTKQDIFQQITNNNLRSILTEKKQQYIDSTMTPFGFFQDNRPVEANKEYKDNKKLPSKGDPYHLTQDQIDLLNF